MKRRVFQSGCMLDERKRTDAVISPANNRGAVVNKGINIHLCWWQKGHAPFFPVPLGHDYLLLILKSGCGNTRFSSISQRNVVFLL